MEAYPPKKLDENLDIPQGEILSNDGQAPQK